MAWTTSGLYAATWVDALDATRCLLDLSLTTHKVAVYTGGTPNFHGNGDTAYTTTNEVVGAGYTAGGLVLTGLSPAISDVGNVAIIKYTHTAASWATATMAGCVGAIWYADANTAGNGVADALIVGINFGGTYTSTAGTFTITPSGSGIFTITVGN